jgi:hypothetical protein
MPPMQILMAQVQYLVQDKEKMRSSLFGNPFLVFCYGQAKLLTKLVARLMLPD